uniref:Ras homolog family member F, filopodia associated n=1 Tax=Myripristis murdjan TaxID=586833 RepID=A0A667ZRR6_9TELE
MTQKGSGVSRQQEEFKAVIVGDRGCGKTSLLMVYTKGVFPEWYPEVQHFCPGVPILLVGCKSDLRRDKVLTKNLWASGLAPITYIQDARRKINAELYLECSAKCRENVEDIFREATKQALLTTRPSENVRDRIVTKGTSNNFLRSI